MSNLISDLPARVVSGILPARGVGEGWVDFDYEAEGVPPGIGLAAGAGSGAGELILDLDLTGLHNLHFALGSGSALRVWFDGDEGYREFVTEHGGGRFQECRLATRDLTNKRLHLAVKGGPNPRPVMLGYIRAEATQSTPSPSARNLVATNDGWSWVAIDGIESERDVWKFFEPLRESDFGLMLWGPGGADFSACHATKIGSLAPLSSVHAYRQYDRIHAEQLKPFIQSGGDILKTAVTAARDVGVAIHFYIRPEAFFAPFPADVTFASRFFLDHPELRCRDELGDEIMRLSYAYRAVQDHMLEYFEELLEYSPDGLCFAFNRSLPMMICEEPVLQEFERLHGRRPNLLQESDSEDMIAARTSLMNGFLQRVREILSVRSLEFSCIVKPDEKQNRLFGLDLEDLCARGVFDAIMVHSGGFHATSADINASPFWQRLRDSGTTRLYPNGWGGSYDHVEAARFLKEQVLEVGFAGGFFWDTENLSANPYNWHVVRRGGTTEYLNGVISGEVASPNFTTLTKIQGVKLDRYNPGASY